MIYVNDNFGRWQSDFRRQVQHCLRGESRGRGIVKLLQPEEADYFVLKPKHSGFFSTTLETLLRYLGSQTLIITGIAGNFCVLFTANDAYMRDYRLIIPSDCTASNSATENKEALALKRIPEGGYTSVSQDQTARGQKGTPPTVAFRFPATFWRLHRKLSRGITPSLALQNPADASQISNHADSFIDRSSA